MIGMPKGPPLEPGTLVQYLKGVGPVRARHLARKGILTVWDLIHYWPRDYQKCIQQLELRQIPSSEDRVVFKALIRSQRRLSTTRKTLWIIEVTSGSFRVYLKYFHQPFKGFFESLKTGYWVRVSGYLTVHNRFFEMVHPEVEIISPETTWPEAQILIPIYEQASGLKSQIIAGLIRQVLDQADFLKNDVLKPFLNAKGILLPDWPESLQAIHCPNIQQAQMNDSFRNQRTPWHDRLIFEEFFWLQLAFLARRHESVTKVSVPVMPKSFDYANHVNQVLGFELTAGQKDVIEKMKNFFLNGKPLNALLMADVGSGKTAVAFCLAAWVLNNGFDVAMMAPTEALAQQLAQKAQKFFEPHWPVIWIRSTATRSQKKDSKKRGSQPTFWVGTHALLEDQWESSWLGLVIIDEQHRFGVKQRWRLRQKAPFGHFLMLSATPIPRSLALSLYGDLDLFLLKDRPGFQRPVKTWVVSEKHRSQVWDFVQAQLQKGFQAYLVYPAIEENPDFPLLNVTQAFQDVSQRFQGFQVGLLHGRLPQREKLQVMESFREGKTQLLVTTSVIEVGIDVPKATVIVVEQAERWGLATLHQLRGRVGRGLWPGFCFLIYQGSLSELARRRLKVMEEFHDGFQIAEKDFELRGPGELLGEKQSGYWPFRMAKPWLHEHWLQQAKELALWLMEHRAGFSDLQWKLLWDRLESLWQQKSWAVDSG